MKQITYYMKSVAIVATLSALLISCDKTEDISTNTPSQSPLVSITANTQVSNTKVTYNDDATNHKMVVKWATNDAFKLYLSTNGAPKGDFTINPNDNGKTSGTFSGSVANGTYTALFPAPTAADATTTVWNDLKVNYTGQTQDGSSTAHMAPYNYMVATNVVVASNAATATFSHLGCVLQFTITMPSGYDYNVHGQPVSLIITAPGMSSELKPSDSTPATPLIPVSTQVLKLKNVNLATTKTFTAYLMSAPFSIPTGESLTITVECSKDGITYPFSYKHTFSDDKAYEAGKRYLFNVPVLTAGDAHNNYVEIGGVKWATGNIVKVVNKNELSFATAANQQGLVFQWGSLIGVNMVGSNGGDFVATDAIVFVPSEYATAHSSASITAWGGIPYEDEKTAQTHCGRDKDAFLRLYSTTGYDAATGKGDICRYMSDKGWLKGNWRMPTSKEFDNLNVEANCLPKTVSNAAWPAVSPTDANGHYAISQGWFFGAGAGSGTTNDMDNPPSKSIFLPAGGYRNASNGKLNNMGSYGHYWSCSCSSDTHGLQLYFGSSIVQPENMNFRNCGFPVRCVLK